jgi:hypothetical protein
MVAEGLGRIGLSGKERRYFSVHAVLDIKHSIEWNKEAIRPAVEEDPARAHGNGRRRPDPAQCGARCFEAYRRALWA